MSSHIPHPCTRTIATASLIMSSSIVTRSRIDSTMPPLVTGPNSQKRGTTWYPTLTQAPYPSPLPGYRGSFQPILKIDLFQSLCSILLFSCIIYSKNAPQLSAPRCIWCLVVSQKKWREEIIFASQKHN
jgi:hypothetical protein